MRPRLPRPAWRPDGPETVRRGGDRRPPSRESPRPIAHETLGARPLDARIGGANRPSDAKMKRHDGLLTVKGAVKRIALNQRQRVPQQQVGLEPARAHAPPPPYHST